MDSGGGASGGPQGKEPGTKISMQISRLVLFWGKVRSRYKVLIKLKLCLCACSVTLVMSDSLQPYRL